MQIQADAEKLDKQLENNVVVAEIRAAGMGAMVDINQNQISDQTLDRLEDMLNQLLEVGRSGDADFYFNEEATENEIIILKDAKSHRQARNQGKEANQQVRD